MNDATDILVRLIACDTQNPPRSIDAAHDVFQVVRDCLDEQFEIDVVDHGKGRVSFHAVRGNPSLLFNVHLDTVPGGDGWASPALQARVADGKVFGRGACDIKGAAASLLAAVSQTGGDVGLLFTTDEEGTEPCCVKTFCRSSGSKRYSMVIVAEPTETRAVTQHRGYLSVTGNFEGRAGHTSDPETLLQSAVHRAIEWGGSALAAVREREEELGQSMCFNIGTIRGGVKNNVVAPTCQVSLSARPPSGTSTEVLFETISRVGAGPDWQISFDGASFPNKPMLLARADEFIERHGLDRGPAVDFWTEAALFSQFGFPAIVLGPGHIAQAHQANEWVSLEQLECCYRTYVDLID